MFWSKYDLLSNSVHNSAFDWRIKRRNRITEIAGNVKRNEDVRQFGFWWKFKRHINYVIKVVREVLRNLEDKEWIDWRVEEQLMRFDCFIVLYKMHTLGVHFTFYIFIMQIYSYLKFPWLQHLIYSSFLFYLFSNVGVEAHANCLLDWFI